MEEYESEVIRFRDSSAKVKKDRDTLRTENVTLKQKGGLIGNDSVLRDYEKKMHEFRAAQEHLADLQKSYYDISEKSRKLKEEINNSSPRTSRSSTSPSHNTSPRNSFGIFRAT